MKNIEEYLSRKFSANKTLNIGKNRYWEETNKHDYAFCLIICEMKIDACYRGLKI